MAGLSINAVTLSHYIERLNRVNAQSTRQWGKMPVEILFPHLRRLVEISLGEVVEPAVPMRMARTALMRWIVLNVPWPRGRIKAPESLFPAAAETMEKERELLIEALKRFSEAAEREPMHLMESPILGPIPLKTWSRIHAKHLNHHLVQFGA